MSDKREFFRFIGGMPRKLRFIPQARTLIAITCRTVQGRFLLRPGPRLNDILVGTLGRAQRRYEITLSAFCALSNHLLLVVDSPREVADFMRYTKSKLAREVNRLAGWRGPVFDRRYEMTVVTDEDAAQIERLKYVLSQSVKEGLVERVSQWPGIHCAEALINGLPSWATGSTVLWNSPPIFGAKRSVRCATQRPRR